MWIGGVFTTNKEYDADYSKYLGPDYKSKYKQIAKTSMMVSNHVSWVDAQMIYLKHDMPCFTLD